MCILLYILVYRYIYIYEIRCYWYPKTLPNNSSQWPEPG